MTRFSATSKWNWGPSADLEMTGGVGATTEDWSAWVVLEVGGTDSGPTGGFSDNFDLTEFIVGADAHIYLADLIDNGNRAGASEALYVDTLTFADPLGRLNLNDLNLYYGTTNALPGQIVNHTVPEPGTFALLGTLLAGGFAYRRRRSRAKGKAPGDGGVAV